MADGLKFKIDLSGLAEKVKQKFNLVTAPETLLRPVAFDLVALMTQRIHDQGLGSDDQPIKAGGYSESYLKVRQEKYNRTADKKVVASLTRQLENDWSVVQIKGGYGVGFKNPINYKKVEWLHAQFGERIFKLSKSEREYAQNRFKEIVGEQFNL